MSKDFGPRFHKSQHILISNLKKKFHRVKEKRKPLSFMMCYIMILVRYQRKILLSKSEWGRREERSKERDEPQESTASIQSHVPATTKASRTLDFLHYNETDPCPSSGGIFGWEVCLFLWGTWHMVHLRPDPVRSLTGGPSKRRLSL